MRLRILRGGAGGAEGARSQLVKKLRKEGWRVGQLLILVDKGKVSEVSGEIFERHFSIELISSRIDSGANLFCDVYYEDSIDLHDIIEDIRSLENVSAVQFSEIIEVLHARPLIEALEAGRKQQIPKVCLI